MIADVVLLDNGFTTIIQSEKPVFCLSAYIIKSHSFEQELLSVLNSIETKFKEVQLTIDNRSQLFCKAHIHVYQDRVTIIPILMIKTIRLPALRRNHQPL